MTFKRYRSVGVLKKASVVNKKTPESSGVLCLISIDDEIKPD